MIQTSRLYFQSNAFVHKIVTFSPHLYWCSTDSYIIYSSTLPHISFFCIIHLFFLITHTPHTKHHRSHARARAHFSHVRKKYKISAWEQVISTDTYVRKYHTETKKKEEKLRRNKKRKNNDEYHPEQGTIE